MSNTRIYGIEKQANESWDKFIFCLRVQYISTYLDFLELEELTAIDLTFDHFLTHVCEDLFYRTKGEK
jgi:hypothetical protein